MGAVRKIQASLPSLPKITYKGKAIGINSTVDAVKTLSSQVAKPVETAAAVTAAVVASTFTGMPVTPGMVNKLATTIKVNTYDRPTPSSFRPSPSSFTPSPSSFTPSPSSFRPSPSSFRPSPSSFTPSPLLIARETAAVNSVAELYQIVLHRGATPKEIALWSARFGATITADEVEQFKIAAQAELAAQTSSTPKTAAKWVIGGITAGLALLWLVSRKKAA